MIDPLSFVIGFCLCYVVYLGFSLIDFFIERSEYYRDMRKNKDDYIK